MEGWRQQAMSSVKTHREFESSNHDNRAGWRKITDELKFSLTPAGLLMEGLILREQKVSQLGTSCLSILVSRASSAMSTQPKRISHNFLI